jgi:hypothetical protein
MTDLHLFDNPITSIDVAAFANLHFMSVSPENFDPLPSAIGPSIIANTGRSIFGGGREFYFPAMDLAPIPVECTWVGPFVNDITCDKCTIGYEPTSAGDSTCIKPPFRPYRGWNVSKQFTKMIKIEGSNPVAESDSTTTNTVVLRKGQTYHIPAPLLEPKETQFVGCVLLLV